METAIRYNRHKLPSQPVTVRIEMWVQEVTSVSELTQDFEIDLYVNEFWEDPALDYEQLYPCNRNLSFDHRSIWSCWRIKGTGPCILDLARFPMDSVSCILTFESFNYNIEEVRMKWNEPNPVILYKDIELPDFTLINFSTLNIETKYAAGIWDELTVSFTFRRRYGWYILQGNRRLGVKVSSHAQIISVALIVLIWLCVCKLSNILVPSKNSLTFCKYQFPQWIKILQKRKSKWDTEKLDLYSRIVFPIVYAVFNVGYWGYYMGGKLSNS
uniref:Neurotransmitter-gated ion-channel ligand-binding domain-containing protein n=1 Tax=Parascaris univalens TaxID=6257 RepID=A0A915BAD1_PARUN